MEKSKVKRVLRQHLKTDELLGVAAVPAGPVADVNAVPAVSAGPVAASASVPAPARTGNVSASHPRPVGVEYIPDRPVGDAALFKSAVSAQTPGFTPLDRQTKIKMLQDMDAGEVRVCRKCVLCETRTNTVFGEGDPDAPIMFVGEGPGETEDQTGRPFVGRAGAKLDEMIVAMGFAREQVFIANVVKCRPPDNRTPTPIEAAACSLYLRRQINIIQPRVIVALGAPAIKRLTNTTQGIMTIRGVWHQYTELQPDGPIVPIMPTFHPAYVLRYHTPEVRGKVWADLKQVMAWLKANPVKIKK